jgi:pimeloyl-ACP methyl ester carboxylesterase
MIAAPRHPRALPVVVFAALAALAIAGEPRSSPQRAAASAPDAFDCPGVKLAPRLASDRGTPPAQTLDRRGRYVPIVMVHGWTSKGTHDRARTGTFSRLIDLSQDPAHKPSAQRSLVGQLQRIQGAAVFTFDYHTYSARWVTDDHLGPALGRAIDCLHEKSGEKVIVVAHSMGGLIARYALAEPVAGGAARAKRVSTVVTFGTPQEGSLIALLADGVLDAGTASGNRALAAMRLILSYCGTLTTQRFETGTLCDILPGFLKAFRTDAGRALKVGSIELGDLDAFPADVTVLDALAGETTLKTDMGWFGVRLDDDRAAGDIDVGDVIVMSSSATHGTRLSKTAACSYQLSAARGAGEQVALRLGQISGSAVAQPLWKILGPCFHTNLMRTIGLTNEATGLINDDISKRAAVGAAQPPLKPKPVLDDGLPVCRDFERMGPGERDVALRRMQEGHGDSTSRAVARLSVTLFCKLNPGRLIDGVYAPGSRAPEPGNGGAVPTCEQWREMNDADGDAALLRLARRRGDSTPIASLRLVAAGYCAIYPKRGLDRMPGG